MNATLMKQTEKLGLNVNSDWAKLPLFDRSKFQRVRFGDVVENVNETERDPAAAGIERFIAMEHLEPGSLHVSTWGNVADGTTFNRRCRPGQVLFGKRRAYQRKVAVAEFDAVVSGDIYLFSPKGGSLLPGLLPFICLSERFFQFAVETSAGSISPRTSWKQLARFEFYLPSLVQQESIIKIMTAVDTSAQSYLKLRDDHREHLSSLGQEMFSGGSNSSLPSTWNFVSLREFAVAKGIVNGPFGSDLLTSELRPEGIPVIYVRDVKPRRYVRLSKACVSVEKAKELQFCDVMYGDVLVAKVGEPPCDAAPYFDAEQSIVTQDVIRIRPKPDVDCRFISELLNSSFGRAAIKKITIGGGRMRVSLTEFKALLFPKPSMEEQKRLSAVLESGEQHQRSIESNLSQLKKLQDSLIEEFMAA